MSNSILKVPGGKLVKVELEASQGKIVKVTITGDFFVHPEEALATIEESLKGCSLQESEITQRVEKKASELGCQLVGFSAADIAKAIALAEQAETVEK